MSATVGAATMAVLEYCDDQGRYRSYPGHDPCIWRWFSSREILYMRGVYANLWREMLALAYPMADYSQGNPRCPCRTATRDKYC